MILPSKATKAVSVLAEVMEREGEAVSTSSARAVVKCFGVLLGFCDLENWGEVKFGFGKLLKFSIDRRPKVRKCAQDCVVNVFKSFESSTLRKEAGKMVLSRLKEYMPLALEISDSKAINESKDEKHSKPEHQDVIHMLTLLKHVAPYLPVEVSLKVLQQMYKLMNSQLSLLAREIFGVIEAIIENSEDEILISEGESLMKSLESYLSSGGENPYDTHLYAGQLLKIILLKFPINGESNMNGIILKLADMMNLACENNSVTDHLQECVGSAVCAIGPEKILTLIPIKLNIEDLTCSNAWLIPILRKYVTGSSLRFFMEHFVPLAESFQKLHTKALKSGIQTDLQDYARAIWGLLPSFCGYPNDTHQNSGAVIFKLIKEALQEGDKETLSEAYLSLSKIIEAQPMFCSSHVDELADLLLGLKPPVDITTLRARLACFQNLLIHTVSASDEEKPKAFLILNEIIITIKDSNEEVRKTAYDMLIGLSSNLQKSSSNATPDAPLNKLISMMIGYLSGASPQIKSGAISALSILVYNNTEICVLVPDLVPSILALLKNKALEVIKAVLGFVKVLVSSQPASDLEKLLPDIVSAILPWSPVSRNHFREKVIVIFEIVIRKCGSAKVESLVPDKYRGFLKSVQENRHGKQRSKEPSATDLESEVPESAPRGNQHKRKHEESRFQSEEDNRMKKSRLRNGKGFRPRNNEMNGNGAKPVKSDISSNTDGKFKGESLGNTRNKGRDFNRVSKTRKPSRGFGNGGAKFAKPEKMGRKPY